MKNSKIDIYSRSRKILRVSSKILIILQILEEKIPRSRKILRWGKTLSREVLEGGRLEVQ